MGHPEKRAHPHLDMCMLLHYCIYMALAPHQRKLTLADLEAARHRDAEEQSEEEWEPFRHVADARREAVERAVAAEPGLMLLGAMTLFCSGYAVCSSSSNRSATSPRKAKKAMFTFLKKSHASV